MRENLFLPLLLLFPVLLLNNISRAQLSLHAQLRTRSELRNGLGTLQPKSSAAAFFTSQRSRLAFQLKTSRVIYQTSIQDVRVWGQDASTISNADGARLAVHEASADIIISDKKDSSIKKSVVDFFSIKIGRQEIIYDDSRLLGNLDWLQQGRRYDAAVFRL